ncbi:golvesin C-terminal-like domain-containing protein [Streptomyces beijiangensis]|uniref:Golvesin/Xly CBD-like domain-containing protein n=1 Tax=Streptomyces beijiangensis TaxID=163361 RepID=A0A939JH20_9ACTN|nr:hypothetical protein [Streptomyces beijiangensis]MBO0511084.1 hypothetical protein [Streptomyces beijiangensis]
MVQASAWAGTPAPAKPPTANTSAAKPDPAGIPVAKRTELLGKDGTASGDRAWSTAGDATGLHILVADAKDAYHWRTVATLAEPGLSADQWVGNACVTGSGKRAVVAYAPRSFTNNADLYDRGAFTAVVDLDTGAVTKVAVNASLAYFDPGCGSAETAVITQASSTAKGDQTQLQTVDAVTGKVIATNSLQGQATSAVPVGSTIVASDERRLLRLDRKGHTTVAAHTHGNALRLRPDSSGDVTFIDPSATTVAVKHLSGRKVSTLGTGKLGDVGLSQGAHGQVLLSGNAKVTGALPKTVRRIDAPAQADLSTKGGLAITRSTPRHLADKVANPLQRAQTAAPETVDIKATATATGKDLSFAVSPKASSAHEADGVKPSPILPYVVGGASATGKSAAEKSSRAMLASSESSSDPVDQDGYCAVPRNDPNTQVYQPTPNQVEWAADMAVRGLLTSANASRPADWRHSGLPAWSPQGMFPQVGLTTGGNIPAQVMLGVLAQESNLWQASSHAEPGEYGNPLIGNYYGTNIYAGTDGYDPNRIWKINWDKADCGYGIGQATDGMRKAGHPKPNEKILPADQQRAVALDYATGISYSAQILAKKWNELHAAGSTIKVNNDDPSRPENWFAAVWNYNAGFNLPGSDPSGRWGLGWGNNPANPKYPADRLAFLDNNHYADAAKPQNWPYEEKVMGWGAFPLDTGRSYDDNGVKNSGNTHGYSAAWWSVATDRTSAIRPPLSAFCDTSNSCDPLAPPVCHDVACYTPHWYNQDTKWKDCTANQCGNEYMTYKTVRSEPGSANPNPGPCDASTLPSGSTLVDELPDSVPSVRCSTKGWSSGGNFGFSFAADEENHYEAKEDLHQIGGGFGGHYYFSHGRQPNNWDNLLTTTGAWSSKLSDHVYKVQAYIPYLGNTTKSAHYEVTTKSGKVYERVVDQTKASNGWVTVGYFQLGANAKVTLSNVTDDATSGDSAVAYDALAFVPFAGHEVHHTFDAVSAIDPNQNLDTNTPSTINSPIRTRQTLYDWARNKTAGGAPWYDASKPRVKGLTEFPACSSTLSTGCVGAQSEAAMQAWSQQITEAGTATSGSKSITRWMGFDNPVPSASTAPDTAFASDLDYKNKTHINVNFIAGDDGKIIPGTQDYDVNWRVGNTKIAPFVVSFVKGTVADYGSAGVSMPDLSFDELDANTVTGSATHVDNPLQTGFTRARAYLPHYSTPTIDSSGQCLNTKSIGGGVDGYRPLGGAPTTDKNFKAWVDQLQKAVDAGKAPQEVADTAGDFYNMFFREFDVNSASGSLLYAAPPIWQNVSVAFCADGSVKSTQAVPDADNSPAYGLVYQGYMPDLYLYHNGAMIDQTGKSTSGPVQRGSFSNFTNIPGITSDAGNPYGKCDIAVRGNGGNPWNISVPPLSSTNETPTRVIYCDDKTTHMTTGPDGD